MATEMAEALALITRAAAVIREGSYDKEAADAAVGDFINYQDFYKLSLNSAAHLACNAADEPDLTDIVYFLLSSYWNDTADWANRVLGDS